ESRVVLTFQTVRTAVPSCPSLSGGGTEPASLSSATRLPGTHSQARGFASQPRGWFAFVGKSAASFRGNDDATVGAPPACENVMRGGASLCCALTSVVTPW